MSQGITNQTGSTGGGGQKNGEYIEGAEGI